MEDGLFVLFVGIGGHACVQTQQQLAIAAEQKRFTDLNEQTQISSEEVQLKRAELIVCVCVYFLRLLHDCVSQAQIICERMCRLGVEEKDNDCQMDDASSSDVLQGNDSKTIAQDNDHDMVMCQKTSWTMKNKWIQFLEILKLMCVCVIWNRRSIECVAAGHSIG